jgi:hypothetical protein
MKYVGIAGGTKAQREYAGTVFSAHCTMRCYHKRFTQHIHKFVSMLTGVDMDEVSYGAYENPVRSFSDIHLSKYTPVYQMKVSDVIDTVLTAGEHISPRFFTKPLFHEVHKAGTLWVITDITHEVQAQEVLLREGIVIFLKQKGTDVVEQRERELFGLADGDYVILHNGSESDIKNKICNFMKTLDLHDGEKKRYYEG